MKRVAIFASCDSFEGFYGGTFGLDRETFLKSYRNDFIWEYSLGLQQAGHEVYIYILSYGPPSESRTVEGLNVRFLPLPSWLRFPDAVLFRMRRTGRVPYARDRLAFMTYAASLTRALRKDQIDVLYNQEVWTPRFDILLEHLGLPIVGADHGAVYAEWMEASKRVNLKRAAKLICQSKSGMERAVRFGGDAVLMYNGVDTHFFTPSVSSETRNRSILSVGRFVEPQKRFSDLLRAVQMLPEFTLTLVGSGPDEPRLKDLATTLGISDRVIFAGFLSSRSELRRLYQECGVFVSSSAWEAVALVLLEAMSCEAPVVATRIPSFEELLEDNKDGLLVPVGSPNAIAEAIVAAYERQFELGIQARNTVQQRYSSENLYRKLSALIEAV